MRRALVDGTADAARIVRSRNLLVIVGALGYWAWDNAVLWATFHAFGFSPPITVILMGYLIGQLGGLLPLPGGLGGIDGGLIGTLIVYGTPAAATVAAVLVYRALLFWLPLVAGTAAFISLRRGLNTPDPSGVVRRAGDDLTRERRPCRQCAWDRVATVVNARDPGDHGACVRADGGGGADIGVWTKNAAAAKCCSSAVGTDLRPRPVQKHPLIGLADPQSVTDLRPVPALTSRSRITVRCISGSMSIAARPRRASRAIRAPARGSSPSAAAARPSAAPGARHRRA